MRLRLTASVLGALLLHTGFAPTTPAAPRRAREGPPTVLAIVEPGGINVLHSEFRAAPGRTSLPPGLPEDVETVRLPQGRDFAELVERASKGPLGHLEPGQLYHVQGTRLLLYPSPGRGIQNVFDNPDHGTGTASSAAGRRFGTDPDAWLIYVLGGDGPAWRWLASQSWIDGVSSSYYAVVPSGNGLCPEVRHIRSIAADGRLVFTAAGNQEQLGIALSPAGAPGAYQVGGVDEAGRTYLRPDAFPTDPSWASATPTRPYETGDRFRYDAADPNSLDGAVTFGGTSGASPSTAGRATVLIRYAREVLGSSWTGARRGVLAAAPARHLPARRAVQGSMELPARGPLADGDLTAAELTSVLHHVAIPAEPPTPARYFVEGYGALNDEAMRRAVDVLRGALPEPERPSEDAAHDAVESLREAAFSEVRRCGD